MKTQFLFVAVAAGWACAVAAQVAPLAGPEAMAPSIAADSAVMARALGGSTLELTREGTSVSVMASAAPAEGGCAAQVVARAPGGGRKWSRLFRWGDVAWTGVGPGSRIEVVFYESDGKLAGDTLAFAPQDAATFRAALARLGTACRAARGESERVLTAARGEARSCHLARLPQLHIEESGRGIPPRAVLTVLARETHHANLELLLERSGAASPGDDEWGEPIVTFVFADPQLKAMRIVGAAFELDAAGVPADHAIAAFGDTRLRITMDPFRRSSTGGSGVGSFYRRLATSGEATLSLLGADKAPRAVLHFDAGAMLAAARKALRATDWSCTGAVPAPDPASRWQPSP